VALNVGKNVTPDNYIENTVLRKTPDAEEYSNEMYEYELMNPFSRYGGYFQELTKHTTVYGSGEAHHIKDPGFQGISGGFSLIHNITIPYNYKIRMLSFGNMPKCFLDTCERANIKLKKKPINSNIIWHLYSINNMQQLAKEMHQNQHYIKSDTLLLKDTWNIA